jgi:chorismate mutase
MAARWLNTLALAVLLAMPAPTLAMPGHTLVGLRGATTSTTNSREAMRAAVAEMVEELMTRNGLVPNQVVTATFTATADLDALYPASIARLRPGWEQVSLLDMQQMRVRGELPRCIRVQLLVWLREGRQPRHVYLRGAASLRPDRSATPSS